MSGSSDRFYAAIEKIVNRILSQRRSLDYAAIYPATVKAWRLGGDGTGRVDVDFEDAARLGTKNDVDASTSPGQLVEYRKGCRVLVGFAAADETKPYVAGWLGGGGSASTSLVAQAVKLGSDAAGDLDRVVTLKDLNNALGKIANHVHIAGTLAAPNGPVTGATGTSTELSGLAVIGSPTVSAVKP